MHLAQRCGSGQYPAPPKRRRGAKILYSPSVMPAPRLSPSALPPLLASDEPPPGEVFNAELLDRAGALPTLFVCDHAGRRVPKALGDLGVDATAFERHIAWDIGAADVGAAPGAHVRRPVDLATYSRLVLDPNRCLDEPSRSRRSVTARRYGQCRAFCGRPCRARRRAAYALPRVDRRRGAAAVARRQAAGRGLGPHLHAGIQGLRAAVADRRAVEPRLAYCGAADQARWPRAATSSSATTSPIRARTGRAIP